MSVESTVDCGLQHWAVYVVAYIFPVQIFKIWHLMFWEMHLLAFLQKVKWTNQYHFHISMVDMRALWAAGELSLKQTLHGDVLGWLFKEVTKSILAT